MDGGAEAYGRFLAGSDSGLEEVIGIYKDSLINFLIQYVRSYDIAEELTEETFIMLYVRRPKFTENAKFRTWLYTIARNKALNYLRSAAFRKNLPIIDTMCVSAFDCPEQRLMKQERYRTLYAAIGKLQKTQREMVYLVYFEEMSVSQAAAVIHKTQRQGIAILYRARQNLKGILEKEGFDNENYS